MFQMKRSNPAGLWTANRLTQMVEVEGARLIFLSGQVAANADYKVESSDIRRQAHTVYDNIEIALRAAGATLANVVKTTTYLTSADYIAPSREVRVERYRDLEAPPSPLPRATISNLYTHRSRQLDSPPDRRCPRSVRMSNTTTVPTIADTP